MPLALPSSKTVRLPTCSSSHSKADSDAQPPGACAPCVNSTDILRGQKTVEISHNGLTYRLQATRLGKLILTK
ncbi:MAG: hemin uptake protein HemP [Polaromonas sp.]|jgi:hemin uptake protein HemP|nr:hemin uptake protein HemP [Polaromonas sp.]